MNGPAHWLSRRELLLVGSAAVAGGQYVRPSLFRDELDTSFEASTAAWPMPGRTPRRRGFVPIEDGGITGTAWRTDLDGNFASEFAVADGTVVVGDSYSSADSHELLAFDAATGTVSWRHGPTTVASAEGYSDGFEGTPAVADGRVFCPTDQALQTLDTSGAFEWRLPDLPRLRVGQAFDDTYLPVGSVVFLPDRAGLTAYDVTSGLRHWVTEDPSLRMARLSPLASDGNVVYATEAGALHSGPVVAIDARDGSERWRTEEIEAEIPDFALTEDTLLVVGRVKNDGLEYGVVQALDIEDGQTRWRVEPDSKLARLVTDGDLVHVFWYDTALITLRVDTGEEVWTHAIDGDIGGVVRTQNSLFCHHDAGVSVFDPETGEVRSRHPLPGGAGEDEVHDIAYADGHLFALRDSGLTALEVAVDE
ncbi:PQQ-binding-like beta-propeller repeat protein [Haloarchaeobius sp. DFWS5]|uniref:PQQ-like beta-propeller repeat protein n=1 Tax=Haloarchaeobius sp. DFWS5 TaxID=3446114 RepID=UPI003EBF1D08